jgi:RNA polymerase sigma factor (sigma-70 family)
VSAEKAPEKGVNKRGEPAYGADPMAAEATELMIRAKYGDRAAFDLLVERLRGRAFRVAHGWVGSREDALELSQEAFLKTYKARIGPSRTARSFLPWFHRILRNTCFSHLRQKGLVKQSSTTAAPRPDDDAPVDWTSPTTRRVRAGRPSRTSARRRSGPPSARSRRATARSCPLRHFEELALPGDRRRARDPDRHRDVAPVPRAAAAQAGARSKRFPGEFPGEVA